MNLHLHPRRPPRPVPVRHTPTLAERIALDLERQLRYRNECAAMCIAWRATHPTERQS